MNCPISEQIAKYADEPESLSASELLALLRGDMTVYINETVYELYEITDLLDIQDLKEAAQAIIEGDATAMDELYINTIRGLME